MLVIEFKEVEIGPGKSAVSHAKIPDNLDLFRGTRIVAEESIPTSTVVLNLFIGDHHQCPKLDDGIPTAVFAENSLGSGIIIDTWQRGKEFFFHVKNNSAEKVRWSAKIEGRAVFGKTASGA